MHSARHLATLSASITVVTTDVVVAVVVLLLLLLLEVFVWNQVKARFGSTFFLVSRLYLHTK